MLQKKLFLYQQIQLEEHGVQKTVAQTRQARPKTTGQTRKFEDTTIPPKKPDEFLNLEDMNFDDEN